MTQELITYQSIDETMSLGKLLAQSGYFADSRDAAQAVVKVLAGRELGFGPIASMTGVNIIKGKVTLSANLIAAAIKRSGRYNYRVRKMTDSECEIVFFEGREEIGVSTFTMDDAKSAGLNNGDNWRKFPRNMLFARAISNGAKWYCPDLSGGPLYTPDELGATIDGETGEVIDQPARVITVERPSAGPPLPKPDPVTAANDAAFDRLPGASQERAGGNGKTQPPAADTGPFEPEEGESVWTDWRHMDDAKAWARMQGKFNGNKHLDNAYASVKDECKPKSAREMWRAWYTYVMAHEPAKSVDVQPEPDEESLFS